MLKTGDYAKIWQPVWSFLNERTIVLDPAMLLFAVLAVFTLLGIYAAARSAAAIWGGPGKKKKKREKSLRLKLAFFTLVFALVVFFIASAPLCYIMFYTPMRGEPVFAIVIKIIFVAGFAALVAGVLGAFILASLVAKPMRKLVRDAKKDRGTSASELFIGREIQKKFLPLNTNKDGVTLSYSRKETPNAVFFGYYEAAGDISGDYFDYRDLDGRYYAIIKCDIAGKGIPAALIMIQVATMFLNYFRYGKKSAQEMRIEELVYQINDFIESMEFKGRFAAFTLCIFDSETGELRFCNAGDNIIHIYDSSQKSVKNISLAQTPAAGVLENDIVRSTCGYHVQTLTLNPGDILLLYTDGIEESKRRFRDASFNVIRCAAGRKGSPHGNHAAGETGEELGTQRLYAIIKAVMGRETYRLDKWHSPGGCEPLVFDFSGCNGGVEELILAVIAVEKMFRCYRSPRARADDTVLVDKKVDKFLKTCFVQYPIYCAHTREHTGNSSHMYYTHLREEEQYDDHTILGIKRREK